MAMGGSTLLSQAHHQMEWHIARADKWHPALGTVFFYSTGQNTAPTNAVPHDINGDGRLNIVAASFQASTVGLLPGQPNGFAPAILRPPNSTFQSVLLGHMNGDGRSGIVITNLTANTIGILLDTSTSRPTAARLILAPNLAHYAYGTAAGRPRPHQRGAVQCPGPDARWCAARR